MIIVPIIINRCNDHYHRSESKMTFLEKLWLYLVLVLCLVFITTMIFAMKNIISYDIPVYTIIFGSMINILMLVVSLKRNCIQTNFQITKTYYTFKDVNKIDNITIINKYYNGNTQKFMTEKDEINSKLNELKELIIKARKRVIGYSEFMRIEEILIDLGGITKLEFETLLQKYNYNFDLLYQSITEDKNKPKIDQIKTSEIIGTLSGSTMSIEYKIATNYEDFIREYKKKH